MLSKRIVACLYRGISQRGQNNVPLYCCHRNTCVRSMSSNVKTAEDTTNGTLKKPENEIGEFSAFTAPKDNPISGVRINIKKPDQYLINHHDNIEDEVTTSQDIRNISDTENVITDQSTQPESDDFDSNLSRLSSYQEHQGQSDLITSPREYSIPTEDEDQRNDMNQENKLISVQDQHPMQDRSIDLDFPSIPKGKKKIYEPIYHLAPLVEESLVLSNLVMLGVSVAEIEKQGAADMLVQLNFENDVQPLLLFLKEIGVADADLCRVITKNPFLFKAEIADLKVRINYLRSKRFSKDNIASIVTRNSKALSLTVEQLDGQLGFYQKQFKLSGSEVRQSMTKCPKLITQKRFRVQAIKEDLLDILGFTQSEVKKMFLLSPNILLTHIKQLSANFDYLHNVMGLSHKDVLMWPQIFQTITDRLKRRHQFLASLGRDQYDPKKENFVSLHDLVSGTDKYFSENVAKSTIELHDNFIKTL
ncbi:mTERF domain-containing protein, mitochondrial [Mytilus galloprovincialis]|uniref:mTERF domain-containing protein, mitochondrial n=1 Tax=Mytilus galloprovincialis TaxID=29158 RepID=A0A8B6FZQ4_MYTGA|nr:mTERF domain-containing protein, mitochondrial [Mytilus galloprovincialis]VDI56711.1 mTERF domain-containing protein, mitochondrial [Mytilus galloprovincialis]